MTYAAAKLKAATSNGLGGDCIYMELHYLTVDLRVNVTQDVAQYPLHHVTYSDTKFKVATSNG